MKKTGRNRLNASYILAAGGLTVLLGFSGALSNAVTAFAAPGPAGQSAAVSNSSASVNGDYLSAIKEPLIKQIRTLNPGLDEGALELLTTEELHDLLKLDAPGMPIGIDAAKSAAISYAGVLESDGALLDADPELDDAVAHYDVEIYIGGQDFDYTVDAFSGAVLSGIPYRVSGDGNSNSVNQGAAYHHGAEHAASSAGNSSSASGDIGSDAALSAALRHAGLSQSQISRLRNERDYEHGRIEYEISFRYSGFEYEYTIDGASGTVLESERDWDD